MLNRVWIRASLVTLLLAVFSFGATAQVVVIPLMEDAQLCPDAPANAIGGPAIMYGYGYCWYLGAGGETCDDVCGEIGGKNVAYSADTAWEDNCAGPQKDDVSTWFFENGNPGGWETTGGVTLYHTLGYGHVNTKNYYGKCSSGNDPDGGTYPGESSDYFARQNVCPCHTVIQVID